MTKLEPARAGVSYDKGAERFCRQTELYEQCLRQFFDDAPMEALRRHMDAGDWTAAFRAAHDMKGNTGNLSLEPLYGKMCQLTDALREDGQHAAAQALFDEAQSLCAEAEQAVREWLG